MVPIWPKETINSIVPKVPVDFQWQQHRQCQQFKHCTVSSTGDIVNSKSIEIFYGHFLQGYFTLLIAYAHSALIDHFFIFSLSYLFRLIAHLNLSSRDKMRTHPLPNLSLGINWTLIFARTYLSRFYQLRLSGKRAFFWSYPFAWFGWSIEEKKQRETITQFEWNALYGAGGEKQEAAKKNNECTR